MQKLPLHDVEDAFALVASVIERSGLELSVEDRDDLKQTLALEAWQLSLTYRPGPASFSTFISTRLRFRVVDWNRGRRGRTRWSFGSGRVFERTLPELVPLDTERAQLELALGTRAGDFEADRDEALRGLFESRDRARARDLRTLGIETRRRVA